MSATIVTGTSKKKNMLAILWFTFLMYGYVNV